MAYYGLLWYGRLCFAASPQFHFLSRRRDHPQLAEEEEEEEAAAERTHSKHSTPSTLPMAPDHPVTGAAAASDLPAPDSGNGSASGRDTQKDQLHADIGVDVDVDVDTDIDIDIDAIISSSKETIKSFLTNPAAQRDASLLDGALSFCNSKFSSYILDNLAKEYRSTVTDADFDTSDGASIDMVNKSASQTVDKIIARVWIEIHHPAIKHFQSSFHHLGKPNSKSSSKFNSGSSNSNNNRRHNKSHNSRDSSSASFSSTESSQNFVEYRKLFDRFVKFISKAHEFYFNILKSILNTYDLSFYIPVKKLCQTLKFDLTNVSQDKDSRLPLPESNHLVFSIIYIIHKCVLFIGDLSRYRTLVAKTYLPSTSISKEDNNNYSKSIELYKLSLLILPALGDPYNHIAIIDNLKDDKFNVVYNFIRASLTSTPLDISLKNLLALLSKDPKNNSILQKFEHLNSLDRNTITKNDRLGLLKSQFLILLSYNLLPQIWRLKPGYLISGHSIQAIEDDFYYLLSTLDFHKQIFNDFYFKQLIILIGGFELLIDKNNTDLKHSQSKENITQYLNFLFRYLETFLKISIGLANEKYSIYSTEKKKNNTHLNAKLDVDTQTTDAPFTSSSEDGEPIFTMSFSTSLLPVVRVLFCWFKERQIARVYLKANNTSTLLAQLTNAFIKHIDKDEVRDIMRNLLKDSTPGKNTTIVDKLLNIKPVRQRLFKEDVAMREFKPINYLLSDFDDSHLYKKDPESVLALIGELPDTAIALWQATSDPVEDKNHASKAKSLGSTTKINDNLLRIVSLTVLGKSLVLENTDGVEWKDAENDNLGRFIISNPVPLEIKMSSLEVKRTLTPPLASSSSSSLTSISASASSASLSSSTLLATSKGDVSAIVSTPRVGMNQAKTPVSNSKQGLKKKKNDNAKNNEEKKNSLGKGDTYAGSSFSTFGAPPAESFQKFEKFKKGNLKNGKQKQQLVCNQSKEIVARPQTSSGVSGEQKRSVIDTNTLGNRPKTSSEADQKQSNDQLVDASQAQYADMVASILNESPNHNFNNDYKPAGEDTAGKLNARKSSMFQFNKVDEDGATRNETFPGPNGNEHLAYFNKWNNQPSTPDGDQQINPLNTMNAFGATPPSSVSNGFDMNNFNYMNAFGNMNELVNGNANSNGNRNNFNGINGVNNYNIGGFPNMRQLNFGQLGSMDMSPSNLSNIPGISNMNQYNMNSLNMNGMTNMNNMNNMGMNNMNNMNNVSNMNNINNMNNMQNLNNLHGIGNVNNLNMMNMNMNPNINNMNMNMNMNMGIMDFNSINMGIQHMGLDANGNLNGQNSRVNSNPTSQANPDSKTSSG